MEPVISLVAEASEASSSSNRSRGDLGGEGSAERLRYGDRGEREYCELLAVLNVVGDLGL